MPPPGPPGPPPPPPPADEVLEPARPGWRTVIKRPEPGARRKGKAAAAAAATPPPPPPPAIEAPRPELPSWAQWRRKHAHSFSDLRPGSLLITEAPGFLQQIPTYNLSFANPRPPRLSYRHPPVRDSLVLLVPVCLQVSFVLTSTCRARNTSSVVSDTASSVLARMDGSPVSSAVFAKKFYEPYFLIREVLLLPVA